MAVTHDVPQIILQQLGGKRFAAMTGARDFVGSQTSLQMRLRRNLSRANRLTITLLPSDTYRMEFSTSRLSGNTPIRVFDDVYAEDLQRLFTDVTGFDTRL